MTATEVVDQIDLGDHVCWTHDDERDALDTVGRFVATGLRLRQKVICFTDSFPPRTVRARLDASGVATEAALAGGQLRIVRAVEGYLTGGRLAPQAMVDSLAREITRAAQDGYPGLRLVGDMSWVVQSGTTLDDLRRYEVAVNRLHLNGLVAAVCLYDRRLFPPEQLRAVIATHPAAAGPRVGRSWTPLLRAYRTADPPGLRLVGQVDRSNREAFTAVLAGMAGHPPATGPAVLDLSELSFADAGAATALLRAAPREVRLVGCRPAVSRLLDLLREGDPVERLA